MQRQSSMDFIPNIELNKRDNIGDNQSINRSVGRRLFPPVVGPTTNRSGIQQIITTLTTERSYRTEPLLPPVCPSISIPEEVSVPKEVSIEEPALITQPVNSELFDPELFSLLEHCYAKAARTPPLILIVVEFFRPCLTLPRQSPGTEDEACRDFRRLCDLQITQTCAVFRWQLRPIIALGHNEP